jgi:hypothetical protein
MSSGLVVDIFMLHRSDRLVDILEYVILRLSLIFDNPMAPEPEGSSLYSQEAATGPYPVNI